MTWNQELYNAFVAKQKYEQIYSNDTKYFNWFAVF